jgi:hypothetical protein
MNEQSVEILKKPRLGLRKLSWEEKKAFCKQWERSGLSKSQFCREQSLSLATFCGWFNQIALRSTQETDSLFTPIRTVAKEEVEKEIRVELLLSNQAIARITIPTLKLGSAMKELCHAIATLR